MPEAAADAGLHDRLVGTVLADRYRIDELIGRGGMGAVYRAEHVHMRKTFAIKVLHQQMTGVDEVVKRFEREAIAAGRIDHPNVAVATDFGQLSDGAFYLVLEYVPGKSLRQLLGTEGPVSVERMLVISRQIAAALQAAHSVSIVHRDLKPDNVMLIEKGGSSDFVKVLDFGIAKVTADVPSGDAQLTRFGSVFGTPQYMAPEQAAGQTVDPRADVYALGLMMHEMVTGKPAFDSTEMIALLTMQMTEPPPPLPAHVPPEARALIEQMLEKLPKDRPATAAEVVQRLDAVLETVAPDLASIPRPPASSSVALAVSQRGLRLLSTLQAVSARSVAPVVHKTIAWGKRRSIARIPNWVLAASVLLVAIVVSMSTGSPDEPLVLAKGKSEAPADKGGKDPLDLGEEEEKEDEDAVSSDHGLGSEFDRIIAAARQGGEAAMYALEQRDESKRTKHEWLALAQGKLKRRQVADALEAFDHALEMDKSLVSDRRMLSGMRYFATKDADHEKVLEFAADHMGAIGADLLFSVWSSTSLRTPYTVRAKELLDTDLVQDHMSPALRVAMDLRAAKTCEDFKKILPRADKYGDERSVSPLKDLLSERGCGGDTKQDCFPCLRGGPLLKEAITNVAMRKAPRLGSGRRWR
jgi:serine/threonine-protein kinase